VTSPSSRPELRADAAAPLTSNDTLDEVLEQVKPRLRGLLHAGMAPLALGAGIVLLSLAPTSDGVLGAAVFLAASVLLFGTSALYHRRTWSPRGEAVMRRMDTPTSTCLSRPATPRWPC